MNDHQFDKETTRYWLDQRLDLHELHRKENIRTGVPYSLWEVAFIAVVIILITLEAMHLW